MISDVRASTQEESSSILYGPSFSIENAEGSAVEYKRVGRVLFSSESEHYTAEIQLGESAYSYDGMRSAGKLSKEKTSTVLDKTNQNTVYYVYARVSSNSLTVRTVADIERDEKNTNAQPKNPQFLPVLDSDDDTDTQPKEVELYEDDIPDQSSVHVPSLYNADPFVSLCSKRWHETCVVLNTYVLLQPQPASRFFPACIVGRSSTTSVHIQWYGGNIYKPSELPSSRSKIISLEECMLAAENRDSKQETMGVIKWPIRLVQDAYDLEDYRNQVITEALENASPVVKLILQGKQYHPIVPMFDYWLSRPERPKGEHLMAMKQSLFDFEFTHHFRLNVLPGDGSLIDPILYRVNMEAIQNKAKNQYTANHRTILATVLFKVVIMRVYLGRNPCDNDQIFFLSANLSLISACDSQSPDDPLLASKLGTLVRNKTAPEIVVSSTWSGLSSDSHLVKRVDNTLDIELPAHTRSSAKVQKPWLTMSPIKVRTMND
ncbi:hypothetical protein CPC08DRAFT_766249 [Agrocybe pediades]|nr:hypothetical protein CPC08DRAFT_766249 [Agrocybe pediades]